MTYVYAMVRFTPTERLQALGCSRSDVVAGDRVLVSLFDGREGICTVEAIKYLDRGHSTGGLLCKESEAEQGPDGKWKCKQGTPREVGITEMSQLEKALLARGWQAGSEKYSSFHARLFTHHNGQQIAAVYLHKKFIELQIPEDGKHSYRYYGRGFFDNRPQQFVRHYLAHTTFNLLEGILRFAAAFEAGSGDYARFFVAQGRKEPPPSSPARRDRDILEGPPARTDWVPDFIEPHGNDERVYLGDGMFVTADGRFENEKD